MKPKNTEFNALVSRFWARVERPDEPNACWTWKGTKNKSGYGWLHRQIDGKRKPLRVHRFSLELHTGEVGSGLDVMHSCDNPSCVNPAHLSYGTRGDNMRDAAAKKRICTVGKRQVTHCPSGHEYTPENTVLLKNGWRRCSSCDKANAFSRYHRRAAALKAVEEVGRIYTQAEFDAAIKFAVISEREACAKLCDDEALFITASMIRERSAV